MTDPEPDEFMARLSEADKAALTHRGRRRQYPAGASLFLEGDSSSMVVVVLAGRVKVFSLTEHGEEVLLAVRGPGALLGEFSAIDGGPLSASVAAREPVAALVVPVAAVIEFLRAHGASREAVAKALRVLRDRGFVTTGRRTMTVLDLDGLRRRAGT